MAASEDEDRIEPVEQVAPVFQQRFNSIIEDDEVVFVSEIRKTAHLNYIDDTDEVIEITESPKRKRSRLNFVRDSDIEIIVLLDSPPPVQLPPPPPPPVPLSLSSPSLVADAVKVVNPARTPEKASVFECGICFDEFSRADGVALGECDDIYCAQCFLTYLRGLIHEKKYPIKCPGCGKELDAWKCASMLDTHDKEASLKLQQLAIEKMALGGVKYCANKKCNNPFEFAGGEHACVSCPLCGVGTCGKCGLVWHEGKTCEQAIGATELAQMAKENNWRHCPACSELIERIDGCNFVRCKCGAGFCFNCGKQYVKLGGGFMGGRAGNTHGVPSCKCKLFQNMPARRGQR